jgi:predicted transcriptional regulator
MKQRHARLSGHTRRTNSYLAGKVIADYRAIMEAIERGLGDMKAGRVISHKSAMQRLRGTVQRIQCDRAGALGSGLPAYRGII